MYTDQTTVYEPTVYDSQETEALDVPSATRWQFIWLCGLILSFCYERALVQLTTMDRLNPRLYDVVFLVGLFSIYPSLTTSIGMPRVYRVWAWIVATFCVCAIVWAPFFPWYYGKYTIFYALKYVQGLITVYMVYKIPITAGQKKVLHWMVVLGGIWVASYAIPQYFHGGMEPVTVARTGEELVYSKGTFISCLESYTHLGLVSAIGSVMTLSLFYSSKNSVAKFLCIPLTLFVAWPAFFCGSRAGLVACVFAWGFFFWLSRATTKVALISLLLVALVFLQLFFPKLLSLEYYREKSATLQRVEIAEKIGTTSSISSRFKLDWYKLDAYRWQSWRIPLVGAGFYVAPHTLPDGKLFYRPAYGIHNDYLFVFEQGGTVAFVLFIVFLAAAHKALKDMQKRGGNEPDRAFAVGMRAFLYSMLIVMMGGQSFWYGFNKANFNTFEILLFLLAVKPSFSLSEEESDSGITQDQQGYPTV